MTKMTKIHVWYDASGKIIAVGHPTSDQKATPLAAEHQFVLETEIDETLSRALHKTHTVDVGRKTLTKSQ